MAESPAWDDAYKKPYESPYCTGKAVTLSDVTVSVADEAIHNSSHTNRGR
jgi:hypothetical protein